MATTDKKGRKFVDLSAGTSAGLKYWLFFLVCFYLLGYSPRACILLGAVGGLAGCTVIAFWKNKQEPKTQQQIEEIKKSNASDLAGAGIIKRQKENKQKGKSRRRPRGMFDWFNRKNQ